VIRAVIDPNVLVSAMVYSEGNEALLVMAINQGLVVLAFRPRFSMNTLRFFFGRGLDFPPTRSTPYSTCSAAAATLFTRVQ
jgi:hypothetical protein